MVSDDSAVHDANREFYRSFEARDLDAMSRVWEHSDRVVCTHPGWATLRGWGRVAASFFALFQNSQPLQFILTNEQRVVSGNVAWVTLDENILDGGNASTVAALNVFARSDEDAWRMVAHHASPVSSSDAGGQRGA